MAQLQGTPLRRAAQAAWLVAGGAAILAFYPRPALLLKTLRHTRRPDVDPDAVRSLAASLPDDPERLRETVLTRLVPYAYDWDVYGVPYYFPTLAEVLAAGRGDCKSQVLVLASLLAAKGVPHRLLVSLDHIWADFEGKRPAPMEDPAAAVAEFRDGRWHPLRPSRLPLRSQLDTSTAAYWRAAPRGRRVLAAVALAGLVTALVAPRRLTTLRHTPAGDAALPRGFAVRLGNEPA